MLFEIKDRTHTRAILPSESHYQYLNSSGRKIAAKIRKVIEDFLAVYPDGHEKEKRITELKSSKEKDFLASFFVIYLYNLMHCLGATEIIIHPTIPGSTKKPDFLVKFPGGIEFYLEAKLIYKSPFVSTNENQILRLASLAQDDSNREMVAEGGIEPPTQRFSVFCSTD